MVYKKENIIKDRKVDKVKEDKGIGCTQKINCMKTGDYHLHHPLTLSDTRVYRCQGLLIFY